MPTIYRKTAKGQTEIETRAHRLAPRFRSLLILVDGRRSDADLEKLMPQAGAQALDALVEGGFIELISLTDTHPRLQPIAPLPTAAAPAPPPAPPVANAPLPPWPSRADVFGGREPPTLPLPIPATAMSSSAVGSDAATAGPWLFQKRQEAVRALIDLCGPMAEPLAMRMEKANTQDELVTALDQAIQLVANTRGRQQAVDYGTRFKGG